MRPSAYIKAAIGSNVDRVNLCRVWNGTEEEWK